MEMEEGQNASEKRAIVKKGMGEIRKQQQQMQEQQMAVQQQMAAAKEQETALKAQEVQVKSQTPIAVAQINKEAKENVKRMEIEHDENVEEIRGAQEQERIILDNQTKKSS
jgi:5-deoxy-D-glucuronate isomerase